LTEYADFAQI
jgi:hypothetical protein